MRQNGRRWERLKVKSSSQQNELQKEPKNPQQTSIKSQVEQKPIWQ